MGIDLKKASAGKRGDKIRSDCYIEIELREKDGLLLSINSKASSMYGKDIERQIRTMAEFFKLDNAIITVEDSGALPFVIAARFECAVKKINRSCQKEYLIENNKTASKETNKNRLRRTRLYLPGNEPKYFINASLHSPDSIILDLEDSVAPAEKEAARYLIRNALRTVDFKNCERMVRINQLPAGIEDLKFIVAHNVQTILIPKCESAQQVLIIETEIQRLKKERNISNDIFLMPIIESALGVVKAYEIASASKYNCALAIGLEDYTADIGAERTNEGKESFFARNAVVNAAKAADIQAIDTVFSDVNDMEGLRQSVLEAKSLGFEGKGCIHPRQIKIIHEAFAPTQSEIDKANKIIEAFNEAQAKGLGAISLGSKMIDAPVVKRAQRIIELSNIMERI